MKAHVVAKVHGVKAKTAREGEFLYVPQSS